MSRDTSLAVPDSSMPALVPATITSFLEEPAPREAGGVGLGVWVVDTDAVRDHELEIGYGWLDETERKQASAYVRAELRRAYEIGHATARLVIGAATGTPPEKVVWGRQPCPGCGEPHGRPMAVGTSIEFSLSHTPGQVLVAIADVPVGVDVERHPDDGTSLAGLLHPDETAEVQAAAQGKLDGGRASVRFTRAWSRTEAYLKGIGIGLGRDPHLDYLGTDEAPARRLGEWWVRDVVVPEGYGAALALRA